MTKSLWTLLFCLSVTGIFSPPVHADIIQIGTLSVTNASCPPNTCFGYTIQNLTDTTMTVLQVIRNGANFGPTNNVIGPGVTQGGVLGGLATPGDLWGFSGNLGSLDFSVGGTQYDAASLSWTTPNLAVIPNGSVAITITATPVVQAVPEPASALLLVSVLVGAAVNRARSGRVRSWLGGLRQIRLSERGRSRSA